jgi:hypothetical protein
MSLNNIFVIDDFYFFILFHYLTTVVARALQKQLLIRAKFRLKNLIFSSLSPREFFFRGHQHEQEKQNECDGIWGKNHQM